MNDSDDFYDYDFEHENDPGLSLGKTLLIIVLAAVALIILWELAAHAFLLSQGETGLDSWSIWARSIIKLFN